MASQKMSGLWLKRLIVFIAIFLVLAVAGVFAARWYYNENLKPVSSIKSITEVTIPTGVVLPEIAEILQKEDLLRNSTVFQQYVRNNGAAEDIKAGTYELSPSFSVQQIVAIITEGKIASNLVTIPPGVRIDEVKTMLKNSGFQDKEIGDALNPQNYPDHPALVPKPDEASLEGYLYPESFQRTSETTAQDIISLSLDEMSSIITPARQEGFAMQGLSTHQAIILASIVEREVSDTNDRRQVAQVFLKRISIGKKLQSDATAKYGAVLDEVAKNLSYSEMLNYSSPYNTYEVDGLPPGPISNITESALQAVAEPANTDWLFFVSGDDGTTYFSKTLQEHEALTERYCKKLCGN